MNVVSLFANVGVSEALFQDIGINVVLANEYIENRANLYSKIYSKTKMICGDFSSENIFSSILKESKLLDIDILMATPPCQGMSNAGQQKIDDERNKLIVQTINLIENIVPKYIFIENVPHFLKTIIEYDGKKVLIPDLIKQRLNKKYYIDFHLIDTKDYSVPQSRKRTIILFTRKDQKYRWKIPNVHNKIVTLKDVIGDIPSIDPFIKDVTEKELLIIFPKFYERKKEALHISKWNNPPIHIQRQVLTMMNTPSSKSAFENKMYKPKKENGDLVKGFKNTYKRQDWNLPAYTVTMDNRKISSQNNVHPGRFLYENKNFEKIYSDARVLTLYEIMRVMTLPDNWNIPTDVNESFIRRVIGEGIPPLFTKQVFEELKNNYDK